MRIFNISPKINKVHLVADQQKTPADLVDEMESHFYLKDVAMTTVFIREQASVKTVAFTTYAEMFDTINAALYQMCREEGRDEAIEIEEILDKEGYGWRFPTSLLPYMKQLIYQAIEVHDARAPEDKC